MQAIILAAGMGKRLGEYTRDNTKCMLEVNGEKLIDRALESLFAVQMSRVIIVVGYKAQNVMAHVGYEFNGMPVVYVQNPLYDKTNNIYSLFLAKDYLAQEDTILLESDLIYDASLISKLVENSFPNIALVAKYETWMDGTMVRINEDNEIVNFIPKAAFRYEDRDLYYKTVNIYKLSREFSATKYVPFLEAYSKAVGNNEYYENVLRIISFLSSHDLKALPLETGDKWYEIDDKQDLDIAEALFADEEHILQKYFGRYGGFWRFPQMLDYCYLVNPFFPSGKLMDEMESNFRTLLTEYPSGMAVNTLLASKCWGVKESYIVPGNGAAELIKVLLDTVEGKFGVIRPTFEEYPNRLPAERVETYIPSNEDFRYGTCDVITYFEKHPVNTLLLVNPDNPTGNYIPAEEVLRLAGWCEQNKIRLILDESFVDFSESWRTGSMLKDDVLESYPHMAVMKSISKSYGVPGLRLGLLASADTALIARIKKKVSIWNINSFAEFFMQIFSKYDNEYAIACDKFLDERSRFVKELKTVDWLHVMPTQANFVFCRVKPPFTASGVVMRMLKEHNILMSNCRSKVGLKGDCYMRIAVRGKDDNERLVSTLKSLTW
ncbi:MAG: aminotransferase class I/II-fold pyridoxal phosphate-dependent enzyme [Bacteroidales bacterium]|nr:aminotransferase class I/II-fold pyridoxal phosphate-dependent enzyme [Bacteroidales bacterium]